MKKILISVVIIISLFLVSCATPSSIPAEKQCTTDSDCVPAQCCHPDSAVNKDFAPDCKGTFCTEECSPGTLDCQQGEIKCLAGACTAVLN